jgi:DNA-binding NarL/FixJ family response regulator
MTPELGVSRSESVRRKLVRKVRQEVALEGLLRSFREEEAELAAELAQSLKAEPPAAGRPSKFLTLDEHYRISTEQLDRVREIVRLQTRGVGVPEIARKVGISPRQVRHVLGADAE